MCKGMRILVLALICSLSSPSLASDGGSEWIGRDGTPAAVADVISVLSTTDLVLLGETHDNPHHHTTQATLLQAMVDAGRRPAVVWEMVNRDRQDAVDAWAAGPSSDDPDAFATAVAWADGGWPDFALYRPIVAVAVKARLPMVAGGLERPQTRAIAEGGLAALEPDRARDWGLVEPLPDAVVEAHLEAVFDGHCQLVPRAHLKSMADVQSARDASLAAAMLGHPDGAVLIAGRGHVRDDVGVPLFLRRLAPTTTLVTLGLTERDGTVGTFDWTRAHAPVERPDPCIKLRERFGKSQ